MGEEKNGLELATLGAGCFWCVEAVLKRLKGVVSVKSGYSGGGISKPTYKEVCSGLTGHAEVVQVEFNPEVIPYATILEVFFKTHDPTTLNRQGADVGTQYRSVIFTHSDEQSQIANRVKVELDGANIWPNPIVTEITPFKEFFGAEEYHHDYYARNASQPYCQMVIQPKLEKFDAVFRDLTA